MKKRPTLSKHLAKLLGLATVSTFVGCTQALYGAAPVFVDDDGDGSFSGEDCDDTDPTIYPGATDPEGDGIDQNCDGVDGDAQDTGAT